MIYPDSHGEPVDHLKSLFDRALDAVVGMDRSGAVIAWNTAAREMFGWSEREALGALMADLIVPVQHRQAHAQGLEHYNRTGHGPVLEQKITITATRRTGAEFPVELSIFAVHDQGQPAVFYAFIRSLELEAAFQRSQELRASEATLLLNLGLKLIDDTPFDDFARYALAQVCKLAELDAAHVFLKRTDNSAESLASAGIWYLQNERFRPVVDVTSKMTFRRGEGLPGLAWQTGELQLLSDIVQNPRFLRRQVFSEVGLTRAVSLPVIEGGELRAVLEFFGSSASRIDDEILQVLKTVGSQVGAAIQKKRAAETRQLLHREMVHRLGNSLTVLSSIYQICSRRAATKDELDQSFLSRIAAMGQANRMSIMEAEQGVLLDRVIIGALGVLPLQDDILLDVPPMMIRSEAVMPLSLVFNELATNALKYGKAELGVRVTIQGRVVQDDSELEIEWIEPDNRVVEPKPFNEGFGSRLLRTMIAGRLGGRCERFLDANGFRFVMVLPLTQVAAMHWESL